MGGMQRLGLFCLLLYCVFATPKAICETNIPVKIKADSLNYLNSGQMILASGNVSIDYENINVKADNLTVDLEKNRIEGSGQVVIDQKGVLVKGHSFVMEMANERFVLKDFKTDLFDEKTNESIFIFSNELTVSGNLNQGRGLKITSCDFDEPHWWMTAKEFRYYPNSHIEAFHTFVHFVFMPVPAMYFPYYQFQLGKRRAVLKMPLVGSNPIEGSFIKTETLYFLDETTEGSVYVDRLSSFGWGVGLRHQTGTTLNRGEIYAYSVEKSLNPSDNYAFRIKQAIPLSEDLSLSLGYADANLYRLPSGRVNAQKFDIGFSHVNDFRQLKVNANENLDRFSLQKSDSLSITHIQDTNQTGIQLNENNNLQQSQSLTSRLILTHQQYIGDEFNVDTKFDYFKQRSLVTSPDDQIFSGVILKHIPKTNGLYQSLTIDQYWFSNLVNNPVTKDRKIQFVEKLPEITLQMNPYPVKIDKTELFTFNHSYQMGTFRESRDTGSLVSNRIEKQSRFVANYNATKTVSLPYGNTFKVSETYSQKIYDTGDQNYLLTHAPGLTTEWFDFFRNQLDYQRSEFQGGSPFYFDSTGADTEYVKVKTTFYQKNLFNWDLTNGKNIKLDRQDDFISNFKTTPWDSKVELTYESGWSYLLNKYRNNIVGVNLRPVPKILFRFDATHDPNTDQILSAGSELNLGFGKEKKDFLKNAWNLWESEWSFVIKHRYLLTTKTYDLIAFSLLKDLHDFVLSASYDAFLKQYMFTITLKLAPDQPISAYYGAQGTGIQAFQGLLNSGGINRYE